MTIILFVLGEWETSPHHRPQAKSELTTLVVFELRPDKERMELFYPHSCHFCWELTLRSGGRRMTRVSRTAQSVAVAGPAPAVSLPPWHPPFSRTLPAPRRLLAVTVTISNFQFHKEWGVVIISGPILYQSLSSIVHITAAVEILWNLKKVFLSISTFNFQFCQEFSSYS